MSKILIFSEDVDLAARLLHFAGGVADSVSAVAVKQEDAEHLSLYGAEQICRIDGSTRLAASVAVFVDLIKDNQFDLLLVGDTIRGRELAAVIAAHLDAGLIPGALSIERTEEGYETSRMLYGGALLKTEILTDFTVITMPGGKLEIPEPGSSSAPITAILLADDDPVKSLEIAGIQFEGVDLKSADVIVGVGLGFGKQEDLRLADDLADVCHGAVGCTRPVAEDKKWLPVEQYIGISGVNICSSLYIAAGISGQVQHTVGTRDAGIIVSINNNESAPIFRVSDYGIVGDLYEVLPLLTDALKSIL